MPIYEYRCERGHTFETMQRMSDDPLTSCTVCEAPVQRVFHPVAVHFKGSGFYNTDYGKKSKGGASSSADGAASSKSDSKADAKSGEGGGSSDSKSGSSSTPSPSPSTGSNSSSSD
jgi:putative FmdB family regulatory protein